MFGYVYVIFSLDSFEIVEAFADYDQCITFFNRYYSHIGCFNWIALNMECYTEFVKRYNETK